MIWTIAIVAVVFGVIRLFVLEPRGLNLTFFGIFKALAHVFVGVLIGCALFDPAYWWIAGPLTLVEVRCELAKWLHNTLEGLYQDGAASLVEVENAKDEMLQRELEMLQEENQ